MTIEELLAAQDNTTFENLLRKTAQLTADSTYVRVLHERITEFRRELDKLHRGQGARPELLLKNYVSLYKFLQDGKSLVTLNQAQHVRNKQTSAELKAVSLTEKALGTFMQNGGQELMETLLRNRLRKKDFSVKLYDDSLLKHEQYFGRAGHKPSILECTDMHVANAPAERVFDRLLWLQHLEDMHARAGKPLGGPDDISPYHAAYTRLLREISEAPAAVQAQYARLVSMQEHVTKKAVDKELVDCRIAHPNHDEDDITGDLLRSDVFYAATGAVSLKKALQSPFMNALYTQLELPMDKGINGLYSDTTDEKVNLGLNGIVKDPRYFNFSTSPQADREKQRMQLAGTLPDDGSVQNNGIRIQVENRNPDDSFDLSEDNGENYSANNSVDYGDDVSGAVGFSVNTAIQFYKSLTEDTHSRSDSYKGMITALEDFINQDHEHISDRDDYLKKIRDVRNQAKLYLQKHRTHPRTPNGQRRVDRANRIYEAFNKVHYSVYQTVAAQANGKLSDHNDQVNLNPAKSTVEAARNLTKAASYQRYIGKVKLEGQKIPETQRAASRFKTSGTASVLHTFINGLTNQTLGRLEEGAVIIKHGLTNLLKKSPVVQELDLNRIPGTNRQFEKAEPEKGPDDQPLITDSYRTPLVWSLPIPADPNQSPKLTLMISQPKEGDDTSHILTENEAQNLNSRQRLTGGSSGHSFASLEYTKIDPLTNKPQRYKTVFGFYPKGGFNAKSIQQAQYMTGFLIPGELHNELDGKYDAAYDVRKEYTLNNKQFNQVVLAAQKYEEGGYNLITRNCTTFATDMVKAAGIDDKILEETDFTSNTNTDKYLSAGSTILAYGTAANRVALHTMEEKLNRPDFSFQRFNQNMVNKQDLKHFSGLALNQRAKGYTPSHIAEMIRNDKNFRLGQSRFLVERKAGGYNNYEAFLKFVTRLNQEMTDFSKSVTELAPHAEDASRVYRNLDGYHEASLKPITTVATAAFLKSATNFQKHKDSLIVFNQAVEQYQDGLNEIFHNTFNADPRLNLHFQKISAILEGMKQLGESQYQDLYSDNTLNDTGVISRRGELDYTQLGDSIDRDRDVSVQMFSVMTKEYKYQVQRDPQNSSPRMSSSTDVSVKHVLAGCIVFGSFSEYMKQLVNFDTLKDAAFHYALDKEGEKTLQKLAMKMKTLETFAAAEQLKLGSAIPDDETIDLYFHKLPLEERNFRKNDTTPVSNIYQQIAMESVYGGLKTRLRGVFDEQFRNNQLLFTQDRKGRTDHWVYDRKSPDEKAKLDRNEAAYQGALDTLGETIKNTVTDHIEQAIKDPVKLRRFQCMIASSANYLYETDNQGKTLAQAESLDCKKYLERAKAEFYEFLGSYVKQVTTDLRQEYAKDAAHRILANAVFDHPYQPENLSDYKDVTVRSAQIDKLQEQDERVTSHLRPNVQEQPPVKKKSSGPSWSGK